MHICIQKLQTSQVLWINKKKSGFYFYSRYEHSKTLNESIICLLADTFKQCVQRKDFKKSKETLYITQIKIKNKIVQHSCSHF